MTDTLTGSASLDNLFASQYPVETESVTVLDGQSLTRGSVVGKILYGAITATADAGNTGNGTVTALSVSATDEVPKTGSWVLTCTDANSGGTSSATITADAGNTGNGTAGAVTPGTSAIEGNYIVTCIDASVSGSEIFRVIDPNGARLEDLTVGAAYSNDHFGVTISDGATDFIVGDFWTVAMTIAHGGKFKLADPDGIVVAEDITLPGTTGGTVSPDVAGITFTITDGTTDFAADDFFTLAVAVGSGKIKKLDATATDGSAIPYGVALATAAPSGADGAVSVAVSGCFNSSALNFGGTTVYTDVKDAMRDKNLYIKVQTASVTGEIS